MMAESACTTAESAGDAEMPAGPNPTAIRNTNAAIMASRAPQSKGPAPGATGTQGQQGAAHPNALRRGVVGYGIRAGFLASGVRVSPSQRVVRSRIVVVARANEPVSGIVRPGDPSQ